MKTGFFLLLLTCLTSLNPGQARASLAEVMALARENEWDQAKVAANALGQTAQDILLWHRLRQGVGTFEEFSNFLATKGDWPGLFPLRRFGERTITHEIPRAKVLEYFRARHAATPHGALHLADAMNGAGRYDDARAEIVLAWRMLPFSRSEQAIFQKEFGDLLKAHNFARMDRFLWRGQHDQVERMFPFLTKGERALARARIRLREKGKSVDARIKAVPEEFQDDPGLAFERYFWRFEKGRRKGAEDLILERSASADSLGRPEYWSSSRRTLARDAMRAGRNQVAYDLAANHHLTGGNDFADLEWLAGYIALTRLEEPETALRHFRKFGAGVESPISLGRAAWWQAEAYEALDRPDDRLVALQYGSEYQTGFYGLLSAEAAGIPMEAEVYTAAPEPIDDASFLADPRMLAGLMLAQAGEKRLGARFFAHLLDRLPSDDHERLGDLAILLDEPHLAVTLAKLAATRGEVLGRPYYPLTNVIPGPVPPELILSITRRESEFNPTATSGVGARGLMQLMPRTAREVSGQIGEPYSAQALLSDPAYNTRVGTEYLRFLGKEFSDNVLLVASAYNAGPGRTREWLRKYGDPRKMDPFDWIESIPFRETRNYVMRVAESVVIYRARLAGEAQEIRISKEIVD